MVNLIATRMIKSIGWLGLLVFALILLIGVSQGPALFNRSLVNGGLSQLLEAASCDPSWFVCRLAPERNLWPVAATRRIELERAQDQLQDAERRSPSAVTRLHLATTHFLSGDRQAALDLLSQAERYPADRSPLVSDSRYEYFLVRARAYMKAENWQAAIEDFHKAMVSEPYGILPVDDRDLYIALAGLEKQRNNSNPDNVRAKYLAGKYLTQAGEWREALGWFQETLAAANDGRLTANELGLTRVYQARSLQEIGDLNGAQTALEEAISEFPGLRLAYVDLFEILRKRGRTADAQLLERRLAALGPTYRLGQYGSDFAFDSPVTMPNGWRLVGYDMDEQLLEQATAIDLVLWWQASDADKPGKDLLRVGDYWLQRQTVRNIVPNSGFEWGMDSRGIPLGYDREYYGAPAGESGSRGIGSRKYTYPSATSAQQRPGSVCGLSKCTYPG